MRNVRVASPLVKIGPTEGSRKRSLASKKGIVQNLSVHIPDSLAQECWRGGGSIDQLPQRRRDWPAGEVEERGILRSESKVRIRCLKCWREGSLVGRSKLKLLV